MSARHGRRLVVGNWKMNLGESAAAALVTELARSLPFDRVDAAVAPAFPCLRVALDAAAGSPLSVAAQNVHAEDAGAFTGEVAAGMLSEMGVGLVIVGHSERRRLFGETDLTVGRKAAACRRHRLVPIVCVGETEAERDAGRTHEIIAAQTTAAFEASMTAGPAGIVVAYEPVWAIGTGRTPSASDVTDAHRTIRRSLAARLGDQAAGAARILYGGSVTPGNAGALLTADEVGGALVGGASLDAATFLAIAETAGGSRRLDA